VPQPLLGSEPAQHPQQAGQDRRDAQQPDEHVRVDEDEGMYPGVADRDTAGAGDCIPERAGPQVLDKSHGRGGAGAMESATSYISLSGMRCPSTPASAPTTAPASMPSSPSNRSIGTWSSPQRGIPAGCCRCAAGAGIIRWG
jgi:hypothetical protein